MTAKKLLLIYLLFAGMVPAASAQQEINFTSLNTRDGLSSNTVNAILKDRFGVMWFATEDGLDKFDGTSFTVYRHRVNDSTSLGANEILSLHEDKSGNLWVGTSGGSLNLYDRKHDAFINYPAERGGNSFSNNVINNVCSDANGRIWVAHFKGVEILDPRTQKISTVSLPPNHLDRVRQNSAIVVYKDRQNLMWIGTMGGLYRWNPKTQTVTSFLHDDSNTASLCNNDVHAIAQDQYGNMWLGTQGGLSMYDPRTNKFTNFRHSASQGTISSDIINSIAADGDTLWLGTDEGLDLFNIRTEKVSKFRADDRNIHSLTAKAVRHIYIDRQGIYWLGMVTGGVNKFDKNLNLFNFVKNNVFDDKGLRASMVTSFAPEKNGNVYVGTEGGGLSLFDRKTRLFRHFDIRSRRPNADEHLSVLAMTCANTSELFIGTFADGLFIFNTANGSYRQLTQGRGAGDLNANDIFCIKQDHKGQVWLGTNGAGVNVLNGDNKVIKRYTPNPIQPNDELLPINGYIRAIEEDREGNIWIGSHGGGIAVLHPASGKFTIYNTANSKLPNNKVLTLLHDSSGNIWAGTFGGGLALFNRNTQQFDVFAEKDGLQNNVVYKIIEDAQGLIWLSTNKGISSINPATKKINNYNYHNGIQHNNFVLGAGLRLNSGELFFGGVEGFNYFNPADLRQNKNIPPVLITELRISNRAVTPSDDGPLSEDISIAKQIDLDYKQNFALSFVGLNYTSPEQNQYAYKLEGFDEDWNFVGGATTASYTNLDPGEYTFRVKASNNDKEWNEDGTSIKIIVHPPFWRTTSAYIFYLLAAAALLWYLRHRGLEKLERKFALQREQLRRKQERKEAEKLQELNGLKIKFLTNLSHEFRTPISLILGPADKLIASSANTQNAGQLQMIRRNAKRLLNLVNQLLDFRKMEEQELKLHATEGELVGFVKELSESFKDLAERKNISLDFSTEIPQYHTSFDHDKIERIVFNLLSNAFKFTLTGGSVGLQLKKVKDDERDGVMIVVRDTGIGISANKKEKIFEQFFQDATAASILNQGTGIGLSITKEFVNMHGGKIGVESEPGKGTTFQVFLPLQESPSVAPALTESKTTENEWQEAVAPVQEKPAVNGAKPNGERPCLLLVEDNDDFRLYLKEHLHPQYKVIEAANGKEGWQHALAHHPALIVSDISMPVMDGIQLTQKIRCDKRTSHIPVILLTALQGESDQIKGLQTGANDYVTKPFNFEVLNVKIKNLLALNDKLKNTYSKQIQVVAPEPEIESEDEKLLQTIMAHLEENLTNPQLSVEELSRHVGMSRSSLYSKLLELTGKTPVEFIRCVKLEKAAVLLEKSDMNVAQIAYSVGFSTPNYFARSFKAKYNMLPSEYLTKMRKEKTQKTSTE